MSLFQINNKILYFNKSILSYTVPLYDADLVTYITGLETELSSDQLTLLNTFITTLKSGLSITNLSDAFDVMYILAGETAESSLRNLVKRSNDATAVNSPTFTQYEGFAGDGATSYIDTNYNPSTQGSTYTLNNAALGVYHRTDNGAGLYVSMGSRTGTNDYTTLLPHFTGDIAAHRMHQPSGNWVNGAMTDARGMNIVTRNTNVATGLHGYYNKTELARTTGTANTTNIPNCNLFINARNYNGTPEAFSDRQSSFAFASVYITTEMRDVIVDTFEAYMDAHGKGVIT